MTKQRLQEYLWLKKNISSLEEQLAEIDSKVMRTTTALSQTPKGKPKDDAQAKLIAKKIKLEDTINRKIGKLYLEAEMIEKAITALPQREQCFGMELLLFWEL